MFSCTPIRMRWLGILGLALAAGPAAGAVEYTATDLGTLFTGGDVVSSLTFAYDLNNNGVVVGYCQTLDPGGTRGPPVAFVYAGAIQPIGSLGGDESLASGVNAAGRVAGWSTIVTGGAAHGFLYDPVSPPMQDLGAGTRGSRVNDSDEVAGDSGTHAGLYTGGAWQDLGVLVGGSWSQAYDVSNGGLVVGSSDTASGNRHAFLYPGGGAAPQDLGVLAGGNWSDAYGINDAGHIVGTSAIDMIGEDWRGFVIAGGPMAPLPAMAPAPCPNWAFDINSSDVIVGRTYDRTLGAGAEVHAFIYDGGTMRDLNDLIDPSLGFLLTEARAINDAGWIAANGLNAAGEERAFLLVPIPEPATLALMGLGAAAMIVLRRRRG